MRRSDSSPEESTTVMSWMDGFSPREHIATAQAFAAAFFADATTGAVAPYTEVCRTGASLLELGMHPRAVEAAARAGMQVFLRDRTDLHKLTEESL